MESDTGFESLDHRLFGAALSALELFSVQLGIELGLYAILHSAGPLHSSAFAVQAEIDEAYARQWLDQQVAAGVLSSESIGDSRIYRLPARHAQVLLQADHPLHAASYVSLAVALAESLPDLAAAMRNGTGIAWGDRPAVGAAIGTLNRPSFRWSLATRWLRALPDIHEHLRQHGGRVLDFGCGQGWSSVALAQAYPLALVDAVDTDARSVAGARERALSLGLADRLRFEHGQEWLPADTYQLICMFDVLHELGDPVRELRRARDLSAAGGAVLVADGIVPPELTSPAGTAERWVRVMGMLHCVPAARASGAGAFERNPVLDEETVRGYASAAGFSRVAILPVEHPSWSFFRLDR